MKDDHEKSPLPDAALDASAKADRAKLQEVLKQHEGPRPEYFAKQSQPFNGESGEDEDGNRIVKGKKRRQQKANPAP